MARFSKRHYNLVSPPADTQAEIHARLRDNFARELATADRQARFGELFTPENAQEAIDYFEERRVFHLAKLSDESRPNWGRTREQVERLVGGYVKGTPEQRARVIDRILETGEGVWHATAQTFDHTCSCAPCCLARGEQPVRI
jgi:hypothetical protein